MFEALNSLPEPFEDLVIRKYDQPKLPVVFIIGLPRNGSTLFQQLIARSFEMVYISNIQARFWLIPNVGVRIIRHFRPHCHDTDYSSEFGNTKGLWEPHEWPWFWQYGLGIKGKRVNLPLDTRIERIAKQLAGLEAAGKSPLVFDNTDVFPYLSRIFERIQTSVFVYIKRDPFYVANSILNARVKRYGDVATWYGPKISNGDKVSALSPVEQCVAQVHHIRQDLETFSDSANMSRLHLIEYDDLCASPRSVLKSFSEFIRMRGFQLKEKKNPIPERFKNRNDASLVSPLYHDELKATFNRYFGE
jgi:hypothetical protein